MTQTPNTPSTVSVRCAKCTSNSDFHREYGSHQQRGPTMPWHCRCSTAALESGDCCSHQQRCGWEPSKAEWWMSKQPSFNKRLLWTWGCNAWRQLLSKKPSQKWNWRHYLAHHCEGWLLRNIHNMTDTRQIHTLTWNCKTRKAWQALSWYSNALVTCRKAAKVPSDH